MRPATPDDVDRIMALRAAAARWLAEDLGSDQWAAPWPSEPEMRAVIRASIDRGETWMAEEAGRVVGTVALDTYTAPGLWTAEEEHEPCQYVHRLIIDRAVAGQGVGARILDWAAGRAGRDGAHWLRADVWTHNEGLHRYYLGRGWDHVRTVERDDYPSGALFQLAVEAEKS